MISKSVIRLILSDLVTINGQVYMIQGALVALVGDTPAVNLAGGYKEGVGQALRKCRQCMATDSQIQSQVLMHLICAISLYLDSL